MTKGRKRLWRAIATFACVSPTLAVLTAAPAPAAVTRVAAAAPCGSGSFAMTSHYRFAVSLQAIQTMYTQAQVKAKHPTSGEVMLGGAMSMMHTMAMGSGRHLEVQICKRANGAVVTGALPTIKITDAKGMTTSVPVVEMEGIGMGSADYHYGNNVAVTAGSRITVTVNLSEEDATFHLTVPKTTSAM